MSHFMLKMHQKAFDGHTLFKPAGELTVLPGYIYLGAQAPR